MKPLKLIIALMASYSILFGQPDAVTPKGITIPGKAVATLRYSDSEGDHLMILSSTGVYYDQYLSHDADGYLWNGGRESSLYATGFNQKDGALLQNFRWEKHTLDCPYNITTAFYPESLMSTDLDNDGKMEVWIMYQAGCLSEDGPTELVLMLIRNSKSAQTAHLMRGRTRVSLSNGTVAGGEFRFDAGFMKAPAPFRDHAIKMWAAALAAD